MLLYQVYVSNHALYMIMCAVYDRNEFFHVLVHSLSLLCPVLVSGLRDSFTLWWLRFGVMGIAS